MERFLFPLNELDNAIRHIQTNRRQRRNYVLEHHIETDEYVRLSRLLITNIRIYHKRRTDCSDLENILSNNHMVEMVDVFKASLQTTILLCYESLIILVEQIQILDHRLSEELERILEERKTIEVPLRVLAKAKLESPMEDKCSICLEQHLMKDVISTDCKHHFGNTCFVNWVKTCNINHILVSCPNCKKEMPKFNAYRERAKNKSVTQL
jgi:hypothetical protein